MTKQPQQSIPKYSKSERKAEAAIDKFLAIINPNSTSTIFDQLKQLSRE